jgi:hypothetical protein
MSYLAVGSVTQSIAALLSSKLNKPPLMGVDATFRVTTLPPDDDRVNDQTGVNLSLYRIHEDPFTKNMAWRGTRTNPLTSSKPPLSLSLSYLLTAYVQKVGGTPQDDITTHQLLGNAMAILHDYPVLNDIHDADFDANVDSQFPPELRTAFDKIKITMLPTSMEEFAHIWTGFGKAYRLSVTYQVSLVEIGPTTPLVLPAPNVQSTGVGMNTFAGPQIVSVTPGSGPAGTIITITGQKLQQAGVATTVQVGDDLFTEDELLSVSDSEIQLAIPTAPQTGPMLAITVACGDRQTQPSVFTVTPWISAIVPLRGITGIPVTIPIPLPAGAAVQVDVDGTPATVTVDPLGQFVTAIIPTTITTNGSHLVGLTLNGQRSNARVFEVLPLVTTETVTSNPAPLSTTIALTGERLDGQDVSVLVGGLLIRAGVNPNPTSLSVTVDRALAVTTPVSVTVDGVVSNTIPPSLDNVNPSSAFIGDTVMLTGDSLSGRNVIVNFNAVPVALGAQPFNSRMKVTVPAGLPLGVVQISVSVDGRSTASIPFTVLG